MKNLLVIDVQVTLEQLQGASGHSPCDVELHDIGAHKVEEGLNASRLNQSVNQEVVEKAMNRLKDTRSRFWESRSLRRNWRE